MDLEKRQNELEEFYNDLDQRKLVGIILELTIENIDLKKQLSIHSVSGSTFTNEELQTIKVDILHIYDKISLSKTEVHKRNLILNKLKTLLGDEYWRGTIIN